MKTIKLQTSQLPAREVAIWDAALPVEGSNQRQITRHYAGVSGTEPATIERFTEEVTDRLARWRDGQYEICEAAQVIADSNPGIDAERLGKQMEMAAHIDKQTEQATGIVKLKRRENGITMPGSSLPYRRIWNKIVRQDDVNEWLKVTGAGYQLAYPYSDTEPQAAPAQQAETVAAPVVVVPAWKPMAVKRAIEIIERQRKKDLYPSQNVIADEVAREFREADIVGAGGKPLAGASIKRHALNRISSEQGRQLSTATSRGK